MANGLWQFVTPDAQLHVGPAIADMYTYLLEYSSDQAVSEAGYYWNDWDALQALAAKQFATPVENLKFYLYSDNPDLITLIFANAVLDVMGKTQPWRVQQELTVDPVSGLITQGGVINATRYLFQLAAPLSRL